MFEEIQAGVHNFHCYFNFVNLCIRFPKLIQVIEDVTWPRGDTKFLFEG